MKFKTLVCENDIIPEQLNNINVWLVALRSGEFIQGKGKLVNPGAACSYEYCCLGVACDINHIPKGDIGNTFMFNGKGLVVLPDGEWFKEVFGFNCTESLVVDPNSGNEILLPILNDVYSLKFNQIADIIEAFAVTKKEIEITKQ